MCAHLIRRNLKKKKGHWYSEKQKLCAQEIIHLSVGSLRVHTCRAMYLRTLLFSVSGSISRWARSSVAQKWWWLNSSKTSLRTSYRYNPDYTCWYEVCIYYQITCFSESWSDWTFMLLDICKRKTWDSLHWIGAIPQKPLWPLHQVLTSNFLWMQLQILMVCHLL